MQKPRVLVYVSNTAVQRQLNESFRRRCADLRAAHSAAEAVQYGSMPLDLLVAECGASDDDAALCAVTRLRSIQNGLPVILLVSESSEDLAIRALRLGVREYLGIPCTPEDLDAAIDGCLARRGVQPGPMERAEPASMGGESRAIGRVKEQIRRIAPGSSTVLLVGETGTGKELAARLIHYHSPRRNQPFVCINCAAVPDSLVESELFGHEKGAFTGATFPQMGKLRLADTGTVLFDEIGDMSAGAQAKLLRAIESRDVIALGGQREVHLDIRIVAATNRNLETLTREGSFRADLFYRLDVARVQLPALREHKSDIPLLVEHFIRHFNLRFGCAVRRCSAGAMSRMIAYDWPGNVRELRNVVEAAFLNRPSGCISEADLPERLGGDPDHADPRSDDERETLITTLLTTNWNVSRAAQRLNWSRMTVYRKMAKYQVVRRQPGLQRKAATVTASDSL